MQAKGLIRYRRGRIVILDRKGLKACTCEYYHVMHDEKVRDECMRSRKRKKHEPIFWMGSCGLIGCP
jgi:hypothetical protein